MDFGTHQTLSCYDGLCRVMEVFNSADRALPFSRTEYEKGFIILRFDFTPGGTSRGAITIIKQGNLNLNIRFQKQLPNAINIIAYLVFDSTISINNNRQAIFDFSAWMVPRQKVPCARTSLPHNHLWASSTPTGSPLKNSSDHTS